jgi:nucleotide-binding universal stress UspA family protein
LCRKRQAMSIKSTPRGPGRNFIPQVRLRGAGCSLKRHFRGALRQVIGRWDYLAEHDPERFVWESLSNTARNCTNYKTGERYTLRWVESVKAVARSLGLISVQLQRVRYGVLREGFILADHDKIAETQLANANKRVVGSYCTMDISRGADSAGHANTSVLTSVVSSVLASVDTSVLTSVPNAKHFGADFGADFGVKPQQATNESSECGERDEVLPENCQSFASPNLLISETFSQLDIQTTAECAVKPNRPSSSDSDFAANAAREEETFSAQQEWDRRKRWLNEAAMRAAGVNDPDEWERMKVEARAKVEQGLNTRDRETVAAAGTR